MSINLLTSLINFNQYFKSLCTTLTTFLSQNTQGFFAVKISIFRHLRLVYTIKILQQVNSIGFEGFVRNA